MAIKKKSQPRKRRTKCEMIRDLFAEFGLAPIVE